MGKISGRSARQHLMEHERQENLDHLMRIETGVRHKSDGLTFALAGNPNCGKTTLFNAMTGAKQYVGNWPGVTVEKKVGIVRGREEHIHVVDLPGVYSLSPYTVEEIVTRKYLIEERPDLIIDIVDATNLERNLYLTTQLAELEVPMVIALNMIDAVRRRGDVIDCEKLSERLGMPVIPISASKGEGIEELIDAAENTVGKKSRMRLYTPDIEDAVDSIGALVSDRCEKIGMSRRFAAVKLFEGDEMTVKALELTPDEEKSITELVEKTEHMADVDHEIVIADLRYRYICAVCAECVKKGHEAGYMTLSDRADTVLTHRIFAIPIFALIMICVFYITFGPVGSLLQDGLDYLISVKAAGAVTSAFESMGVAEWATGLVVDGIISGVGSVVSFFPQILLLFLFLSILEDSGYMARAAFIMDRALNKIGLTGKAFVPMLMGFGCTVPAILATRTLENEKDRRLTCIITPFMSCTARMPVYALFISAFFPDKAALVITSVYFGGIVVAVLSGLLLKKTVLKGEVAPFVMELPPYRLPTLKSLYRHLYERIKDFLVRAGTVLLGAAVVVWFLSHFTVSLAYTSDASQSLLAALGTFIAPVFAPLGFGNWQSAVSLLSGFIAKESIVSTMGVLLGSAGLDSLFTPETALSFIAFVLLYTPCVAALSATVKEIGSGKWALFAVAYQTLTAWVVSFAVRRVCVAVTGGAAGVVELLVFLAAAAAVTVTFIVLTGKKKGSCGGDCGKCGGCG